LKILLLPVFILLLVNTHLYAQEAPALPIEINADSLVSEDKKGRSVYQGSVVITQGATEIKGDKVTVLHPERTVHSAIIIGTPARFKQFNEVEKSWTKGRAKKITYNVKKQTVLFEGDAFIEQEGKSSISSPSILYNSADKTLKASGNEESNQRVKVIFSTEPNEEKQ